MHFILFKEGGIEEERMNFHNFCHGQHWEKNSGFTKGNQLGLFALVCMSFTTWSFITWKTKVFYLSAELTNSVRSPLNAPPVCLCGAALVLQERKDPWRFTECQCQWIWDDLSLGARIHWAFQWELLTLFRCPHGLVFLMKACKLRTIGKVNSGGPTA